MDLPCTYFSVPKPINLSKPLDIQMQHLSRHFPLIADNRQFLLQGGKPGASKLA